MTQPRLHLRIVNMTSLPDGGPLEAWLEPGQILEAGRDGGLDWCLPDPQRLISSRHFEIRPEKGGWVLVDLSTNGTFLNGATTRVKSPCPLHTGDRLQVGQYSIEINEDRDAAPEAPLFGPVSAPGATSVSGPAFDPQPVPRPAARSLPGGRDPWALQADAPVITTIPPRTSPDSGRRHQAAEAFLPPTQPRAAADIWGTAVPEEPAFPQIATPAPDRPRDLLPHHATAPVPDFAPPDFAPQPERGVAPAGHRAANPAALLEIIESAAGLAAGTLSRGDPAMVAQEIGETLRALTEDLAGLLQARAVARRSVKATQVTMIGREDNNPLKFMPTPDQALSVMFGPPRPGFQRGPQAVRAGFADIRSHQYATHAALQPALAHLLADLAPEAIEKRLEGVRLNRKSRAWELFVERWDAKTHAHDNGMLDVFLTLFADAYDRESGRGRG